VYPRVTRDIGYSGLYSNHRQSNTIGRLRAIRVYLIFVYDVRIQMTHLDRIEDRIWRVFRMLENISVSPDVFHPPLGEPRASLRPHQVTVDIVFLSKLLTL